MAFDFSTLVTDRKQSDVAYVKQLIAKIVAGTETEAELAEWKSFTLKGAYNHTDLNRVTAAMESLKSKLEGYGYDVPGYQRIKVPHVLPEPEPTSRLPEGYTELTYIESTGTQYIDTGFVPNQDTRVVMDIDLTSAFSTYGWITLFATRNGSSVGFGLFSNAAMTSVYHVYASKNATISTSLKGRHTVDKNKNETFIDGNSIGSFAYTAFIAPLQLRLLYDNQPNGGDKHPFVGKVYSCQIYDNGTLVRDYVPCKNVSGVFGLYDLANDEFYQNAGTGAFTAGEEIAPPADVPAVDEFDPYLWYEFDWPTPQAMTVYLLNVSAIRAVLNVMESTPQVPDDMVELMVKDSNDIEVILMDVYRQINIMATTFIPCGEALCGGDNL